MRKRNFICYKGNLAIRGYVFGYEDGMLPKPAIILSHGFLANQKMCYNYAKLLVNNGYVAFTFDFCGGGLMSKSDGKSVDMTIFTEQDDLLTVVNYVKTLPYIKEDDISLLGCSQGGLVSMLTAKAIPDDISKLILLYPALCIPDDARKGKMIFYRFNPKKIPPVLGHFPMKLGKAYANTVINMDIMEEIGGFNKPVLYLHGTADKIVPIKYARQAREKYSNCKYYEILHGQHMFRGKADKIAQEYIKEFLK